MFGGGWVAMPGGGRDAVSSGDKVWIKIRLEVEILCLIKMMSSSLMEMEIVFVGGLGLLCMVKIFFSSSVEVEILCVACLGEILVEINCLSLLEIGGLLLLEIFVFGDCV